MTYVGWMSGQDTTSQDPFSTTRCSRKKEETKLKENNQNMWISHKRARLHGTCKLHYEKKILQEKILPSTLVPQFLSHKKNFLTKALSLRRPPEPLKLPLSAVQKPPCSFSQHHGSLSLRVGSQFFCALLRSVP